MGCSRAALLLAVAACGRVGFDAAVVAGDAARDSVPGDAADGGATCGHPGQVFCDGFESGLGAYDIQVGQVAAQSTVVHTGSAALAVTTDSAQLESEVGFDHLGDLKSGSLHARAWLYVPSSLVLAKVNLYGFDSDTQDGTVFIVDQDKLRVYNAEDSTTITSTGELPRDQWFCVEVHIGIAAGGGTVALDLAGAQIASAGNLTTLASGGLAKLSIGMLFLTAPSGPGTLYIDDVAAGTQPVGCD